MNKKDQNFINHQFEFFWVIFELITEKLILN